MSPSRRRAAVEFLKRKHKVSERRACRVVGQHRSTNRYSPVPGDFEARLMEAIHKIAGSHPRYGYRRVHALLVADGWNVNVKRVERLWRREGLAVPPRRKDRGQKAIGTDEFSAWALPALKPVHIWSYDFVSVRTLDGGPYVERFNGSMRDELLNGESFRTVTETRVVIESWLAEYNNLRPHRALGMKTPAAFAAYCESQNNTAIERVR